MDDRLRAVRPSIESSVAFSRSNALIIQFFHCVALQSVARSCCLISTWQLVFIVRSTQLPVVKVEVRETIGSEEFDSALHSGVPDWLHYG